VCERPRQSPGPFAIPRRARRGAARGHSPHTGESLMPSGRGPLRGPFHHPEEGVSGCGSWALAAHRRVPDGVIARARRARGNLVSSPRLAHDGTAFMPERLGARPPQLVGTRPTSASP